MISRVQLFATPWTMDYSPTGSSLQGIFQTTILEWVDISYSGDLPHPGIKPMSSASPALQEDSLPLSHRESPLLTPYATELTSKEGIFSTDKGD